MQIFVAQLFRKFTLEHVSFSALVYLGILFTLSSALYKNVPLSVLFYFVFFRCLTSGHYSQVFCALASSDSLLTGDSVLPQ